jgi:hypothetical protein
MKLNYRKKLILFFVLLAVLIFGFLFIENFLKYQIRIYSNVQASEVGKTEIKRCYSFKPNFECISDSNLEGKYIKVVTYRKNIPISDSGWEKSR